MVHITVSEVLTGGILYGIVHAIYYVIVKILRYFLKQLQTETGRIIQAHVKAGHKEKFKNCFTDTCAVN